MQVNYKNVMQQYNLGPNGGILTSLNLFATRFDQVREWMDSIERQGLVTAQASMVAPSSLTAACEEKVSLRWRCVTSGSFETFFQAWVCMLLLQVIGLCEKPRDPPLQYIVADTPGQIEIFTWSASGDCG